MNVGDDVELHGLHISPDLDTVTYTVAGAIDPERGWGLAGETWHAMEALARYPSATAWFNLGDRDLATHLFRTDRLPGRRPAVARSPPRSPTAWALGLRLLPVTDDRLQTRVTRRRTSGEIGFQEYFVQRQHAVAGHRRALRRRRRGAARRPGVLDALGDAPTRVVIAPSNPLVSIAPVLAVPGVRDAVEARRADAVAVSPIIAGAALKGPADRLLRELGHEATVVGVARLYAPLARHPRDRRGRRRPRRRRRGRGHALRRGPDDHARRRRGGRARPRWCWRA